MYNKELEFDKKRLFKLIVILYDAGGYGVDEINDMLIVFMKRNNMIQTWHNLEYPNRKSYLTQFLNSLNHAGTSTYRMSELWHKFMDKEPK